MSDTTTNDSAHYFRVPLETARAIKEETGDPEALLAWLAMRRFTYGHKRELTCTGAKKVAAALGITRPRASKVISSLLALRFGEGGQGIALATASDWNAITGQKFGPMKGNAPVYVSPLLNSALAYLPDLLIPSGEARSPLAGLCNLDAATALDCLHLLLLANEALSCGDYLGADPSRFAYEPWMVEADEEEAEDLCLGHIGDDGGFHYWVASPRSRGTVEWAAIEGLTGGRTEDCAARYWAALDVLRETGHLCRVAIVSDDRDRLQYPLYVFGESHRDRLRRVGIVGDLARVMANRASRAGLDGRFETSGEVMPDLFVVATKSDAPPRVRTVYMPTLTAPTPENMAGFQRVGELCAAWS